MDLSNLLNFSVNLCLSNTEIDNFFNATPNSLDLDSLATPNGKLEALSISCSNSLTFEHDEHHVQ